WRGCSTSTRSSSSRWTARVRTSSSTSAACVRSSWRTPVADLELPSRARRKDILHALRTGTVPEKGLEHLAVGLDRFGAAVVDDLRECTPGRSRFKAVRGDYGAGKTFFSRYFTARALALDMAVTEVQVSEVDTPLYRLETVYR